MAERTYSGARREQFNLRERAVSDDFNRLQGFAAAAAAELHRRTHLASTLSAEAGGKASVPSASGTPPSAVIFEGLLPRPEIGTVNLFVSAGALAICLPASSPHPDDDPARLIRDPGVTNAGDLTLTPGAVATRIDVVECQPYDLVQESDSRDVFDPATGTYAPVLLDKVVRGALAYRIRTGTPGGGFPGAVADWLPLAVARVPSSATTWDDCDVWDVRPLLADLARPPHLEVEDLPRTVLAHGSAVEESAGQWRARGTALKDLAGRKCGGQLAPAQSGATYLRLDSGGGLQEPGFAATPERPWYLFLAHPHGLCRWSKLSPASSGERTPQAPRGIPIFSQKALAGLDGRPGSALSLPTATGLGGTTTNATCVMAGYFGTGLPAFRPIVVEDGRTQLAPPGIKLTPTGGAATDVVTYDLIGNTTHPASAVELLLRFQTSVGDAAGQKHLLETELVVRDALGNDLYTRYRYGTEVVPGAGAYTDWFELWIPLAPNLPAGAPQTQEVQLTLGLSGGGGGLAYSNQFAFVAGWRLL